MLLVALFAIVALATVPIMVGARMVNAEHTGFGRALLVAFVLGALGMGVGKVLDNQVLGAIAQVVGGGFLISGLMGTSFPRGIAIGLIATVLQFLVILAFAGALVAAS